MNHIFTSFLLLLATLLSSAFAQFDTQGNLSDQCYAEIRAILVNPDFLLRVGPTRGCIISEGEDTCTIDYVPDSSAFKNTCLGFGYKPYISDIKYVCVGTSTGTEYTFNYLSYAVCIGASCTDTEWNTYYTDYFLPDLAVAFANSDDLSTCDATDLNEMSNTGATVAPVTAAIPSPVSLPTNNNDRTPVAPATAAIPSPVSLPTSSTNGRSNGMHHLTTSSILVSVFVIAFIAS
jgi:hypothetical protein